MINKENGSLFAAIAATGLLFLSASMGSRAITIAAYVPIIFGWRNCNLLICRFIYTRVGPKTPRRTSCLDLWSSNSLVRRVYSRRVWLVPMAGQRTKWSDYSFWVHIVPCSESHSNRFNTRTGTAYVSGPKRPRRYKTYYQSSSFLVVQCDTGQYLFPNAALVCLGAPDET